MAGIPQETIDTVIERTDIVSLIQNYVPLKKQGSNFVGLCPFHQEKTPSFSVNPRGQYFYCFGCHKKGNSITFIIEYRGLTFVETIEELALGAGVVIPKNKEVAHQQYQAQYDAMNLAAAFYSDALSKNTEAQDYLEKRGIPLVAQKRLQLGYAAKGSNLHKHLTTKKIDVTIQRELGLIGKNSDHDFFQSRIIFPIHNRPTHNRKEKVIGFGGRILTENANSPKYINSPDSPIFHKKRELYFSHLLDTTHKQVLITEGYLDAITLHLAGIPNPLAVLGTAFTEEHIISLKRRYPKIIFCYDSDTAGKQATTRTLTLAIKQSTPDTDFRFMSLPAAKDPDEFIAAHGKNAFLKQMEASSDLTSAIYDALTYKFPGDSLQTRSKKIAAAIDYIKAAADTAVGFALRDALQDKLKIPFELSYTTPTRIPTQSLTLAARIINALIQFPALAQILAHHSSLPNSNATPDTYHNQLTELKEYLIENPSLSSIQLQQKLTTSELPFDSSELLAIISSSNDLNLNLEAILEEFQDIVNYWLLENYRYQLKKIAHEMSTKNNTASLRQPPPQKFILDSQTKKQMLSSVPQNKKV